MSARSAAQGRNGNSRDRWIDQALGHLAEALAIIDSSKASPEIGARLQEVMLSLEESRGARQG